MELPKAIRRLTAFCDLSPSELLLLRDMAGKPQIVKRKSVLIREGEPQTNLFLLHDGWAMSSVSLLDGTRQITKLHLAGDLLGTTSLPVDEAVETVRAMTECLVSPITLEGIGQLFQRAPRVAAVLFLIAQQERIILTDRLTIIGKLKTAERIAALLVHVYDRLRAIEPEQPPSFDLPLSQEQIGDVIGATAVHVNRKLQHLAEENLIRYKIKRFDLLDVEALRRIASLPNRKVATKLKWLPEPG